MSKPWLLYGAYGYTGRLIAEVAVDRGLSPVLAGRDPDRTRALAEQLKLEHRPFSLDDARAIRQGLGGMAAVLHAAGPFSQTYRAVAEACLETGTHYLDITGEIDVFEALHGLDGAAKQAGVVLLPGVGFDVVPTDCAVARVAERIAEPTHVAIAFHATGPISPGTMKTMVESLGRPGRERRDGQLVDVPHGSITRRIPFTDREREAVCIPWGDVSTAWFSTGIPNIRVYRATSLRQLRWVRLVGRARPLLAARPMQLLLDRYVGRTAHGPDAHQRARGMARVWCQARNARDESATVELTSPNGYALTADSAVSAVYTLLDDRYSGPPAGTLTPSRAFGHTFVDTLDGVTWTLP